MTYVHFMFLARRFLISQVIFFFFILFSVASSEARWKLLTSIEHDRTEGNYNSSGTAQRLPNSGSYNYTLLNSEIVYDRGSMIDYFGDVGLAYAESIGSDYARTDSGLSFLKMGLDYFFERSSWETGVRGTFKLPLRRVNHQTDTVLLGEGDMSARGDFFYRTPIAFLNWASSIGFEYRDEGRSSLLHYQTGISNRSKPFQIGADLIGFMTVIEDEYTSSPSYRNELTRRVDGGSQKFYAINPDLLRAKFWAKYWLDRNFSTGGAVSSDLAGKNTSSGFSFLAFINFDFGSLNPPRKHAKARSYSDDSNFTVDTDDGVDQRIFDSESFEDSSLRKEDSPQRKKNK